MASPSEQIVTASDVTKSYGRVVALAGANIEIRRGEIVGLVGDNGAGKSTLAKVLAGVHSPDSGEITYFGEQRIFRNPREARLNGIETVHQSLGLAENLAVYQNIYLGREITRGFKFFRVLAKAEMRRGAAHSLSRLGVQLGDVRTPVTELSGGQRQFVGLARAVTWQAPLVLLDEPTAALSTQAADHVLRVLERMRDAGIGILIISHDIPHVLSLCDRVVVLRRGRDVASLPTAELDPRAVVSLMTGADGSPHQDADPEGRSRL
jgi:simple sugar transport system ATP-binding protein